MHTFVLHYALRLFPEISYKWTDPFQIKQQNIKATKFGGDKNQPNSVCVRISNQRPAFNLFAIFYG